MIVKSIDEIIGTKYEIKAPNGNWISRRMLLKNDKMGFSFHETIIKSGTKTHIHYKNHLEAVYCIGGNGKIEDIKNNKLYEIKDGVMYALDKHDEHYLYGGDEDMRLICVFNPPLNGDEIHREDGSYEASSF